MKENEEKTSCDLCRVEIPCGRAYHTIHHTIEYAEHNNEMDRDEIQVLHSIVLMTLCVSCGKKFNLYDMADAARALKESSKLTE